MTADKDASRIDWEAAKARLRDLGNALAASDPLTRAQSASLMRQRAELLAQSAEAPDATEGELEVVCFQLGSERVAVAADLVIELLTIDSVTPVPNTPDQFIGITNLRGQVTSIFDVGVLLQLPSTDHRPTLALVLGRDEAEFGIAVDGVDHVRTLQQSELVSPPASANRDWITAVTADGLMVLAGDDLIETTLLHINETD